MKTATGNLALTLLLALAAGAALAQETQRPADVREEAAMEDDELYADDGPLDGELADEEEARPLARRTIKVLEHPYQIASFYRQREGSLFAPAPEGSAGPYALAGFYRQGEGGRPYGYSRFWTTGYGRDGRDSRGLVIGYRRSIGENGDLFLLAPGFLAPLGPLSR